MANFSIKQGDTRPSIKVRGIDSRGNPRGLSEVEYVKFEMIHEDTDEKVVENGDAIILDEENGEMAYRWRNGDTDRVGDHQAEFIVEYTDGGVETFPNKNFITVTVYEDVI